MTFGTVAGVLGLVAMAVGLVMVVAGSVLAWRTEAVHLRETGALRGTAADFASALARLLEALAVHPVGIRLATLGILVFFLGGVVAGVGALAT